MMRPYTEVRAFVQHLAPTWRKPQHENFARLLCALLARGRLNLCDLARALEPPSPSVHGRLKRLTRFLDNPHLDEAALSVRWLKLAYRFGAEVPQPQGERPLVPLLLDTTYFPPFAALVVSSPCGSRGLPLALTTYHCQHLRACFPPLATWPGPYEPSLARTPRPPAAAVPTLFLSQNQIEEHLLDYVYRLLSPALRGVTVGDGGFARARFFRHHYGHQRDFAIRFDAQTHIRLPRPVAPGRPLHGPPATVLGLRPGQRCWCPQAWYGQQEQVPIRLLAVWERGQEEPWYIATSLETAEQTELVYRWRMRLDIRQPHYPHTQEHRCVA